MYLKYGKAYIAVIFMVPFPLAHYTIWVSDACARGGLSLLGSRDAFNVNKERDRTGVSEI